MLFNFLVYLFCISVLPFTIISLYSKGSHWLVSHNRGTNRGKWANSRNEATALFWGEMMGN